MSAAPEDPLVRIENEAGALSPSRQDLLKEQAVEVLRNVFDPEIPVNIYDLGLIYRLEISGNGLLTVEMTLTSPACPVAGSLPGEVAERLRELPGVGEVNVELVWDPPWTTDRMSEGAKLELGFL